MHHIVCLSTTAWHGFPTRKQQVMSRIPDAEILYFDPPVTYLAPLRSREAREKLGAWKEGGEAEVLHPPARRGEVAEHDGVCRERPDGEHLRDELRQHDA